MCACVLVCIEEVIGYFYFLNRHLLSFVTGSYTGCDAIVLGKSTVIIKRTCQRTQNLFCDNGHNKTSISERHNKIHYHVNKSLNI